nr:MAG TPA: hypothetical protein [Caudoviricetes sp.]
MNHGVVFDGCQSTYRCTVRITNKETPRKEPEMTTEMNDKINCNTAYEWLENHYENVPGIWEEFDQEAACESLAEVALEDDLDSYDNVPVLTLMCIMADARM